MFGFKKTCAFALATTLTTLPAQALDLGVSASVGGIGASVSAGLGGSSNNGGISASADVGSTGSNSSGGSVASASVGVGGSGSGSGSHSGGINADVNIGSSGGSNSNSGGGSGGGGVNVNVGVGGGSGSGGGTTTNNGNKAPVVQASLPSRNRNNSSAVAPLRLKKSDIVGMLVMDSNGVPVGSVLRVNRILSSTIDLTVKFSSMHFGKSKLGRISFPTNRLKSEGVHLRVSLNTLQDSY
ncbi:hypothetical protein [Litoreibacter albidus]|uniref:PRC-barrel domain-containing protein n=1 Tax=Litoreibacter albidus TaxID=670155 RepID=A0A1H2ZIB6_9RHOB|nr:hypothetical protein [Litoreibacter albidus]SDX16459.1 hypothetical protein SAMN04488001_2570 [Litoreibacter albidus]